MPYRDKEVQRKYLEDAYKKRAKYLQDLKASTPCVDCGKKFPYYVMDFDHVTGEKIANLNTLRWSAGWKRLKEEVGKCEIVCSNCHRIRTHERALVAERYTQRS